MSEQKDKELALKGKNVDITTQKQLDDLLGETTGSQTSLLGGLTVFRAGKEDYFKVGDRKAESAVGIFLMSKRPVRAYWESDELSAKPPSCFSLDGVVPHEVVEEPESEKCDDCPWNKMGSGKGRSKKCKTKASDFVLLLPQEYEVNPDTKVAWPEPSQIVGPGVLNYSISNRGSDRAYSDWLRGVREKGMRPQGCVSRWSFGSDKSKSGVPYSFVKIEVLHALPSPTEDPDIWAAIAGAVQGLKGGQADEVLIALSGMASGEADAAE